MWRLGLPVDVVNSFNNSKHTSSQPTNEHDSNPFLGLAGPILLSLSSSLVARGRSPLVLEVDVGDLVVGALVVALVTRTPDNLALIVAGVHLFHRSVVGGFYPFLVYRYTGIHTSRHTCRDTQTSDAHTDASSHKHLHIEDDYVYKTIFQGETFLWEICLQLELVHLWAHTELDDVQFLLCDSNLNNGGQLAFVHINAHRIHLNSRKKSRKKLQTFFSWLLMNWIILLGK